MIGPSKILTVSYGTFSCTLEGFDDPFNTMRAIAEYFRDLAAEDRYFGAEPPTPDAAMLHKIAEREVHRRVEAKIQENGVVLRTGDAMQTPVQVQMPPPAAPVAAAPAVASPPPAAAPMPDGVAAKLLRIRAAVANAELAEQRPAAVLDTAPVAQIVPQVQPILNDYSEDQHADEFVADSAPAATFAPDAAPADLPDLQPWANAAKDLSTDEDYSAEDAFTADADFATEDDFADLNAVPLPDAPLVATPAQGDSTAADDDSTLAALIKDHAAALPEEAQNLDPAESTLVTDSEDYVISQDELEDLRALDGDLLETALHTDTVHIFDTDYDEDYADLVGDAGTTPADALFDTAPAQPEFTADVPDAAAIDPMIEEIDSVYAPDVADPDAASASSAASKTARARERMIKVRRLGTSDAPSPVVTAAADTAQEDAPSPDRARSDVAMSDQPLDPRARARMIKVRRSDAANILADLAADEASRAQNAASGDTDDAADITPDFAAALAAEADADAAAAAEAEATLRRELRLLQRQSDAALAVTPDADLRADPGADDDMPGASTDARPQLDPAGEAAVSRLIEQTNEVMAVPENRRRLSAIAHLKAAVAATVADRFGRSDAAPKEAETKRLDPYREDLALVVRPTQPEAPAVAARPAPLVLVSAQRIDRPRTSPADSTTPLSAVQTTQVRPRRISSAALAVDAAGEDEDDDDQDTANIFSDARGFAEFSERLGANNLAEILEAAAAYSVCIEGRPYFSRPLLMSQIGALSADSEYSREDGLRTFGALLREGRIQKIKRGQFILTENSRYLAEARTLAG